MTLSELAQELPALKDEAKHLWGDEEKNWPLYKIKDYQFHLQQMLISDNPTKYLKENTK